MERERGKSGGREGRGGGRRNGVLPPRRLSERITQEQQHQQRYDDERSIPTIFFKAALLKYLTRFIIKNNQCGILRRHTAGAESKQSRTEESSAKSRRTRQDLGQRPWLRWWRRARRSVSPINSNRSRCAALIQFSCGSAGADHSCNNNRLRVWTIPASILQQANSIIVKTIKIIMIKKK